VTYDDSQAAVARNELSSVYSFPTELSCKDILCGVANIQKLFREGRLFVMDNSPLLITKLQGYRWHPLLDRPTKDSDDLIDAARYALVTQAISVGAWSSWRKEARKV
jgi:hypothetical protein